MIGIFFFAISLYDAHWCKITHKKKNWWKNYILNLWYAVTLSHIFCLSCLICSDSLSHILFILFDMQWLFLTYFVYPVWYAVTLSHIFCFSCNVKKFKQLGHFTGIVLNILKCFLFTLCAMLFLTCLLCINQVPGDAICIPDLKNKANNYFVFLYCTANLMIVGKSVILW